MLRAIVECKYAETEKLAHYLSKLSRNFKIWIHHDMVYALFDVDSLSKLTELRKKLRRTKGIEHRFIKIEKIREPWKLRL